MRRCEASSTYIDIDIDLLSIDAPLTLAQVERALYTYIWI